MPDGGVCADLVFARGGSQALETLKKGGRGRVAALFERSFYVEFVHGWVCLGTDTLPMGPLNVRSGVSNGMKWAIYGLQTGDTVESSAGRLRVGRALNFDMGGMVGWAPPAPPPWTVPTITDGLDAFDCLAGTRSGDGLADFVSADWSQMPRNGVVAAAHKPIQCLSRAAACAFAGRAPRWMEVDMAVIALLGLGPGLTPSGDDFLGGMLIALDALPAPAFRACLRDTIENHARRRTNAISLAHLRAAGAGAGHAVLHDGLHSLLAGDRDVLPDRLAAIDKIGHSSGRDALAGICVTLRAFVSATEI